jgi:hypothetical protein
MAHDNKWGKRMKKRKSCCENICWCSLHVHGHVLGETIFHSVPLIHSGLSLRMWKSSWLPPVHPRQIDPGDPRPKLHSRGSTQSLLQKTDAATRSQDIWMMCIYIYSLYIYNIYTVYIYTRICVYESIHEHAIKRMCGIFWHWTNINHGGSIQNKNMRTAQVCRKCGSQLQFMASLLLVFGWQRQMLGDLGLHCILILKASWSSALRMILLEQLQNPMVTVSITWD